MNQINSTLKNMKLEEKCAFLSGKNHWQSWDFPHLEVPSLFFSDGPHGVRKQLGSADHLGLNASQPATCFPTSATIANSWDTQLARQIGAALGAEAASQQVDVLLGPGLNIKRNPLCGRNFEYFSEDPYLSGKMASGYVKGIQSQGVAACPKHFAANSQETIRMSSNSVLDMRTLREIYLTAFEMVVTQSSPRSIMSSYNKVNGTYGNESKLLLTNILRQEWGFQGIVVTDWGGSNSHVDGVKAGSTLQMPGCGFESAQELINAVHSGQLDESVIDKRAGELLELAFTKNTAAPAASPSHHTMACQAAEGSIVLLKNNQNTLPLSYKSKVAIIGDFAKTPRYQGAGSSFVEPTQLDIPLDTLSQTHLNVIGYAQGFNRNGGSNPALLAQALELAKQAETVLLYIGLPEGFEIEGMDRTSLSLPQNQLELLHQLHKQGSNIVVILSAGSSVEMGWESSCQAILHGYLSGQAGAQAMARVLTGQVCPSGKLAETYVHKLEDTPSFHYYPSNAPTAEYREGLYVGYRYYQKTNTPVLYPFGFGLSYTTFTYSSLQASETAVTFTLTNTGSVTGAEIAQLYIGCNNSQIFRPVKELKGFAKQTLKPGESKQITIPLDSTAFRYFNIQTNQWEVEPGIYTLSVGSNSEAIHLTATLSIQGTQAPCPYKPAELPSYYSGQVQQVPDQQFSALLGGEIPSSQWPPQLEANTPLCRMQHAKSGLARLAYKILESQKRKKEAKGIPDLNILFILNVPFRAIGKMTNGMVGSSMVKGMLQVVNGHFFKGVVQIIKGYFSNAKHNKAFEKTIMEYRSEKH